MWFLLQEEEAVAIDLTTAILITVLAINLVGEGLNDALNPRLRERN